MALVDICVFCFIGEKNDEWMESPQPPQWYPCVPWQGEKRKGVLERIKVSLFNQDNLKEFLTIYPCCAFHDKPYAGG